MAKKDKDLNKIEDLKNKIKELEEKNNELENNWKRALADYQNFRRRMESEKSEIIKYSNENLMRDLIPVIVNFDLLLKHSDDPGLKITINNFKDILNGLGLKELNLLNTKFDSTSAEAVEVVEGKEDNLIIEVLEKGYKYNNKIIKPAKVKVSKKELSA